MTRRLILFLFAMSFFCVAVLYALGNIYGSNSIVFNDGIRTQVYKMHSHDFIHCDWQSCERCPSAKGLYLEIASIKQDKSGATVDISFTLPYTKTSTFREGELIEFPNPCTGVQEVIGKVNKINQLIYFSTPPWFRKLGIQSRSFYIRPDVRIEFYHSWLTEMYGHKD